MYYKSEYSIAFRAWLDSPLGQKFSNLENNVINTYLPTMFGYNAIILGEPNFATFLQQSCIKNQFIVNPLIDTSTVTLPIPATRARQDKLPIDSDVVDLVYVAHCLEFTNNPHEVLRESHRILRPDGHVIITLFNPLSLWGIYRLFARWGVVAPWRSNFMTLAKLKDWLALLGFDIMRVNHFGFCLPFNGSSGEGKISFLEKYCQKLGMPCGAAYVIEASKRIIPITPIKQAWTVKTVIDVHDDAAEPTV